MAKTKEAGTTRSIFQLDADWKALNDLIEECGGELSDPQVEAAYVAMAESLAAESGIKADRCVNYILFCEGRAAAARAEADQYAAEADRFVARAKSFETRIDRTKDMLKGFLLTQPSERMETASGRTLRTQKNSTIPIVYDDLITMDKIPPEYILKTLDRNAVAKALKENKQLEFAKYGVRGTHLRIDHGPSRD